MGDLERIADYANMILDRMKQGQELDSWMYSQITLSVDQLNSVHDTMDGKDGVKESVNEGNFGEIDIMAREARNFNEFVKEFYKDFRDFPKDKDTLKWLKSLYDGRSKDESVNEGKYYVTYNKGRGQGKGLEKEFDEKTFKTTDKPKVFNSYNDAKKYAEKMEKLFRNSIGGGIAYWVSDEKMNPIKESVNEGSKVHFEKELKNGKIFQVIDRDTTGMRGTQDKFRMQIVDKSGKVVKDLGSHPSIKGAEKFGDKFESINEATEPEIISQLKDIVKNKQYQSVKDPKSGKSVKVDMQTANAVLQIYNGLSNVNKDNMVKMGLPKMIDVSFKIINKYK